MGSRCTDGDIWTLFESTNGCGRHDFSKRAVWRRELVNSAASGAPKQPVKPARDVHVGEFLQIRTEGGEFEAGARRKSHHSLISLLKSGVAVEKLISAKIAKMKLRQDAI